jgi:hypothetical protein
LGGTTTMAGRSRKSRVSRREQWIEFQSLRGLSAVRASVDMGRRGQIPAA